MSTRPIQFSYMIVLDTNNGSCLYEQLYQQLRDDIAAGRLEKGAHLKSLRESERDLHVSRTTVSRAYQQLISEGYVRASHGSGYFVEDIGPTSFDGGTIVRDPIVAEMSTEFDYDFSPNYTESNLFPWKKWRKALNAAIDRDSFGSNSRPNSSKGTWHLRENLARFLYRHRGVRCVPEQVIVCADAYRATDVILSLLNPSAHRFAFEEPGVASMRSLIRNRGFDIRSIPSLDEWTIKVLGTSNCNAVFTMPSCQLPMGSTMSLRTRNLLLRWASLNDAYIIEYDHHARFQSYGNAEVPSIQSLDKFQNVVYIGTLSEVLPPTLSLAYLVLPSDLLSKYDEKYSSMSPMLPGFFEQAFADIIERDTLSRYIRKVEVQNKQKLDLMARCIEEDMPAGVSLVNASLAGYAIVKIKGFHDRNELIEKLGKDGICVYSIYDSCYEHCTSWDDLFVLGFASMDEADVKQGCSRLAQDLNRFIRENNSPFVAKSAESFQREFRQVMGKIKQADIASIAQQTVTQGTGVLSSIENNFSAEIQKIGDMFDRGEIGICELIEVVDALVIALNDFGLNMSREGYERPYSGTVVQYTVKGDLHDLGKNIIRIMLEANNFEVYDLGCDTTPDTVLAKAQEVSASVIMGSALMTTTMPAQKDLITLLEDEGVRDDFFVMFGGAPVTEAWVQSIGGDAYTDSATDAVNMVKKYMGAKSA